MSETETRKVVFNGLETNISGCWYGIRDTSVICQPAAAIYARHQATTDSMQAMAIITAIFCYSKRPRVQITYLPHVTRQILCLQCHP
jgi:hypothetical protein